MKLNYLKLSFINWNWQHTQREGQKTLDEGVLAGYNTNESNNSNYQDTTNYLHTGQDYWTFSPVLMDSHGYARVGTVSGTGTVAWADVDNAYGVRPVVSLISGTLVETNGDGTRTKP